MKAANKFGGSGDVARGAWCTPKDWADAIGPWDLDPFSNPRSHVASETRCMLEDGGDGLLSVHRPGSWRCGATNVIGCAGEETRVFVQPPYELVLDALGHYGHTRFCFLLRFDPRTRWFQRLYRMARLICVPQKIEFDPPPGMTASANIFPHAFYYANPDDVTDAVLRKSAAAWRPR